MPCPLQVCRAPCPPWSPRTRPQQRHRNGYPAPLHYQMSVDVSWGSHMWPLLTLSNDVTSLGHCLLMHSLHQLPHLEHDIWLSQSHIVGFDANISVCYGVTCFVGILRSIVDLSWGYSWKCVFNERGWVEMMGIPSREGWEFVRCKK